MADTATTNPTHSFPTVSFDRETRTVAATQLHGLVTFTTDAKYGVDFARMTVVEPGCDALIFPSYSDGTERPVVLNVGDSIEFSARKEYGLTGKITRRDGSTVTTVFDGYYRVIASGQVK